MSDKENPSGLNQEEASGELDSQDSDEGGKQTVSFESHRKLLGEKKKLAGVVEEMQKKLAKFERAEKQRTEQELQEQQRYKELLSLKEEELAKKDERLMGMERQFTDMAKFDAFQKALGQGLIERKYWGLVNLDEILVNPDSKEVDEMSVTKYVEKFQSSYPEVIKRPGGAGLPANAPKGGSTKISYDEWTKLPVKEMRSRMKEVMQNEQP
jgi:hypothetical protein